MPVWAAGEKGDIYPAIVLVTLWDLAGQVIVIPYTKFDKALTLRLDYLNKRSQNKRRERCMHKI